MPRTDVHARAQRFLRDVAAHRGGRLICRGCGSAMVDVRDLDTLACCACGATAPFDGRIFHVVREAYAAADIEVACGGHR